MKMAKAAAGIAGIALALGAASPALAAPNGDDELVDANTVSKSDVKNPLYDVDIQAVIGGVTKVADKLKADNDLKSKTNALQGARAGR